jgi:hypothetical protein
MMKKTTVVLTGLALILLAGISSGKDAHIGAAGDCRAAVGVNFCADSIADVIGQIGTGTGSIRPKMMSIRVGL